MPSKKRQVGIRLTPENEERLGRVLARMRAATNLDITITDVFNAALVELEKRYPPEETKPGRPRKGE